MIVIGAVPWRAAFQRSAAVVYTDPIAVFYVFTDNASTLYGGG